MEVGILVVAVAVVAFVAGFMVRGRDSGRGTGPLREPRAAGGKDAAAGAAAAQLIGLLEDRAPVEAAIRAGRKINAIKEFRAQTRCGLKDAKDAVEAMEREMARRVS